MAQRPGSPSVGDWPVTLYNHSHDQLPRWKSQLNSDLGLGIHVVYLLAVAY